MFFKSYRDYDSWRLRKVVCEVWLVGSDGQATLLDRTRMFAWPFLAKRLAHRKAGMLKTATTLSLAWGK
jgi:hypothetical protein